jgi:hypothetical protein
MPTGGIVTGDSGTTLGLDLAELYRAGAVFLPAVADEFAQAASAVGKASDVESAFSRDPIFAGYRGPAYQVWESLRADLDKFLHDTSDNLRDVGAALVLAANTYASTDEDARKELDRLKVEWRMP